MANYKISNLTVTEVSTEASAIEDDMGAQEAEMGESIPDESVPTATLPEGMMPGELDPEIPLPEELGPIVPPTESDDEEPADPAEPLPTIPDPGDIAPPPDEEGPYVPGEAPEETP